MALTVEPAGRVIVTAPPGVSAPRLDRVVHSKAQWVVTRLREAKLLSGPLAKAFVSGETFLYLGRQYRLHVVLGEQAHLHVSLEGSFLRASVRQASEVRPALVQWYVTHAEARIRERVQWWASKIEVAKPRFLIREQEKRWGSCSPGVVRFNWRIIQAPLRLVDYVVAHELTHLIHSDHGPAFWSRLGLAMPDYESRREQLLSAGASFGW